MLKKSQRLTTKQVLDVIKSGKIISSPLFSLRYTQNQPDTRIGTVAPVKVAKTAVARNSARRRMYGALKGVFPSVIPGIHAIIFSRNDLANNDWKSIENGIEEILIKANLIIHRDETHPDNGVK